jgi:hypothetical protein
LQSMSWVIPEATGILTPHESHSKNQQTCESFSLYPKGTDIS